MNRDCLLDNAGAPVRYNIAHREQDGLLLPENAEAKEWIERLIARARAEHIGDIHGSHDYRMENILGKCWVLGLSKDIPAFAENAAFILRYLGWHIETSPPDAGFGRIYFYRDQEKVLACLLPLMGYAADPAVLHIARKRLAVLHPFTRQNRYDIYVDGSKLKGVKSEWQPHVIDPDLYAGGHITLPDMHDLILLAGMLPQFNAAERAQAECVVAWLFGEGFAQIPRRYGYFYAPGGSYSTKAIIFKPDLGERASLVLTVFVLSHFQTARESAWFTRAIALLRGYQNEERRYVFPANMLCEKPDSYVIFGGHMNVGENKKSKLYRELLSTYWMERIIRRRWR